MAAGWTSTLYLAVTRPSTIGPIPLTYIFVWGGILIATQFFGLGLVILPIIGLPSLVVLFVGSQWEPRFFEMLICKINTFGVDDLFARVFSKEVETHDP